MKLFSTYELMTESFQYDLVSVMSALVQEMSWRRSGSRPPLGTLLKRTYVVDWYRMIYLGYRTLCQITFQGISIDLRKAAGMGDHK